MAQCDGIDGYADGIIEDPLLCHYRPEALICPPGTPAGTSTCITGAQARTVRAVFSDLYGENGTFVYPRMQPGSELLGTPYIYYSGQPFQFAQRRLPTAEQAVVAAGDELRAVTGHRSKNRRVLDRRRRGHIFDGELLRRLGAREQSQVGVG